MSNAHAQQYYFGSGAETYAGSGEIVTYEASLASPEAAVSGPGDYVMPSALYAPIAQDKQRGSS